MRIIALLIISHLSLFAAELRVTFPNDDRGLVLVESMSDDVTIKNPEERISQEGQIAVLEFKNLKAGEYLVRYLSALDPMGYVKTIMATRVRISDNVIETVMLFTPQTDETELPKDVHEFLKNHRDNYLELEAVYDGYKKSFAMSRGSLMAISGLRTDCVYSIKVWDHSSEDYKKERKVIFEKTFRAIKTQVDDKGLDE